MITIRLPSVLKTAVGTDRVKVEGTTLYGALEAAFEQYPRMRAHLMQESGELRPHVLCLVNGTNVLREELATAAVNDGDEILIHQAISGG